MPLPAGGGGDSPRRVRFEILAADSEKDNIKEADDRQRRFLLAKDKDAIRFEEDNLIVCFEHRPLTETEKICWKGSGIKQQSQINKSIVQQVSEVVGQISAVWLSALSNPAPTDVDPECTLLAKHVARYTAKNSFDYFIHKNLGDFLRSELDLYVKAEVLNVDDLSKGNENQLNRALAQMRVVCQISEKIIDFLAQIENFQKSLWLKKKFVLETQWCVTLDRIPFDFYSEIAANKAQREEWTALFAIDEIKGDLANGGVGYGEKLSTAFLHTHSNLIVDTRHFNTDFKDRLLASISDAGLLDEQTDGLLVHGENFQALSLLLTRYANQVQCVYIDPPYNTDASAILYKNNYKHSSWLSLMSDRLVLAYKYLTSGGVICVAIDDEEVSLLRLVMKLLFHRELGIVPVRSNPAGRKSKDRFSPTHEYAIFYGQQDSLPGNLNKTEKELKRYPHSDEIGHYAWSNLIRSGAGDRRQDSPTMFFPIYVANNDFIRVPAMQWNKSKQEYKILEDPEKKEIAVWPLKHENDIVIEKRWHRGRETIGTPQSDYRVRRNHKVEQANGGVQIDFKVRMDTESTPKTWWDGTQYASANLGPKILKDLFGRKNFDFAKSVSLVEDCLQAANCRSRSLIFDFFAGSATTGHSVINLNRKDSGNRKYLLVEMGDYFDTVVVPRIKKVVYAPNWKSGKPIMRDKGVSQLFKYIRLESYEDTLDGIMVNQEKDDLFSKNESTLAEDYRLRYAIGVETSSSACLLGKDFTDPFSYTLSVVRDGMRRETPVDLPETFNFLLGLRVESHYRVDGVLAIAGKNPQGQNCLVLWRNLKVTDNGTLECWFTENRNRFSTALELVYVNGDHTLNAIRQTGDIWVAETIEPLFRDRMFETNDR